MGHFFVTAWHKSTGICDFFQVGIFIHAQVLQRYRQSDFDNEIF